MNTFLRFYLIFLVLVFCITTSKAGNTYFNTKLAGFKYNADLNDEQQKLLKIETEAYEKTIAPLYKTDLDEYKKKLNEFFYKLACGFKIYNLTARNDTLNSYIADFQSATRIKVYVISYVEGAFLNNMFQKLAELRYKVKQKGYAELKFRFTKVSQSEEDLRHTGTCELVADSTLLAKIKSNLKDNYRTTASLNSNLKLSENELNALITSKAEELLGQFKKLKITSTTSALFKVSLPKELTVETKSGTSPSNELPGYRFAVKDFPVTFSEDLIMAKGTNKGIKDIRIAFTQHSYISQFILNKETFINNYTKCEWLFDNKTSYKKYNPADKSTVYTFNLTFGYIYGELSVEPALFDELKFKESIAELYKEKDKVKEYFYQLYNSCTSQSTISTAEKGNSIDEIIRICDFIQTLDKDKWDRMYSNFGNKEYTIHSSAGYRELFENIYNFCNSFDGLIEKIMACETPGTKEGQMTYLARQLKDSHYKMLTPGQRFHILQVISNGEMYRKLSVDYGELGEKDIVVNVLKFCTKPSDTEELITFLSKPGTSEGSLPVIASLVNKTDELGGGAIFEKILGEVTRLIQNSSGFQTEVSEVFTESNINERVVKWDFPKLTNSTIDNYTGAIFLSDIGYDEQTGKVTFRRQVLEKYYYKMRPELCMPELNPGCIKEGYDLADLGTVSLNPMDLLVIIKHTDNSYGDESKNVKDEVLFVPAYYLYYYKSVEALEKKIRAAAIAIDLATIASGAGVFTEVAPMLRRAWIGFRFLNAAGNITLNAANIADPTLRNVVLASDLVVGSIGFTELMMLSEKISIGKVLQLAVKTSGQTIETLKTNIKNFIETVERNQAAIKALGVKEASMGKIVEDLFVLKDAWKVKSKELWGVVWGNAGAITNIESVLYKVFNVSGPVGFGGEIVKKEGKTLNILGRAYPTDGSIGTKKLFDELKALGVPENEITGLFQRMPREWSDMKIIDMNTKYWEVYNQPHIDKIIANGGDIRFIHDPRLPQNQYNYISQDAEDVFSLKAKAEGITRIPTFMKWEYDYLVKKGYVLQENGLMIKPLK